MSLRSLAITWFWAAAALAGCATQPRDGAAQVDWSASQSDPGRMIVVAVANPRFGGSTAAGSTAPGYLPVQPYLGGAHARGTIDALKHRHGLVEVAAWPIQALRLHCAVLQVPPGVARDTLLQQLATDPALEIAQPLQDFVAQTAPAAAYNDPYAPLQRGLAEVEAWSAHAASSGRGIGVAVVDTGVDAAHPDLQGRVASVRNLVDRDAAQFARDRHGTEVAGVIAAVANNRVGIVGVAPQARLRVYKACWQQTGGGARCNSFTLAQALAASLDDGAQVINLSLAGPADALLSRLLRHAIGQGRVVVGAVPADGSLTGFPLGVPGVIAVDTVGGAERDGVLRAPGRDILTLVPGGHYDFDSGSSLAAAHVTGVVALLLALPEPPRPAAVQSLLARSRQRPEGAGSVSACAAITALRQSPGCAALPPR